MLTVTILRLENIWLAHYRVGAVPVHRAVASKDGELQEKQLLWLETLAL